MSTKTRISRKCGMPPGRLRPVARVYEPCRAMFAAVRIGVMASKNRGGQIEFPGGTVAVNTSWVVPAGVTSISVVNIAPGGLSNTTQGLNRAGTYLCSARSALAAFDVLNLGGTPGASTVVSGTTYARGGGGAGGYSGAGGAGGTESVGGSAGNGGGGSGGGGNSSGNQGNGGGGVGSKGEGASGAAVAATAGGLGGSSGTNGGIGVGSSSIGTTGPGGSYGGGATGTAGGSLAYKNNIPVTPGETLTIVIPAVAAGTSGPGCVRIIWGPGRTFPFNAADV